MAKASDDKPHIEYINMGPWPLYVGFTTCEKSFKKEMARLCPSEEVAFLGSAHANATAHYFTKPGELLTVIVAMEPKVKRRSVESYAGLIAHEVCHIIQQMRDQLISDRSTCTEGLGIEAEAYLQQYLTQEMLAIALDTGRRNRVRPVSAKSKKEKK
jgi:hypothetical protein